MRQPKRLGTPVPRICIQALGTGYARKSGEPLGFRPKEGTCASTGAHPLGETSTSRWRRSALPMMPGADFVGGHQSGLAGSKPPPLFTHGTSSCSSQGRRQGEPRGASPRPSAPPPPPPPPPHHIDVESASETTSPVGGPVLHMQHTCSGEPVAQSPDALARPASNNMPLSEHDTQELPQLL